MATFPISVIKAKLSSCKYKHRFLVSFQGIQAKAFLSDARQPELDFLHSCAVVFPKF